MAAKRKTLWLFVILLVLCASSALASIPTQHVPPPLTLEEKLALATDDTSEEPDYALIDRASVAWLDEASHIAIDLSDSEPLIKPIELFAREEPLLLFRANEKLASELRTSRAAINVRSISELVEKAGWGEGFHAYPFVEPANGKVYARARWYDPQTGTFMSPDPMGYADSSNLYAGFAGDPLNNRDPRGERIRLNGENPGKDYMLLKRALANPAAAEQLRLVTDKEGVWLEFRNGREEFLKTAITDSPDYARRKANRNIPTFDSRSIEAKMADLIAAEHVVDFRTGESARRYTESGVETIKVGSVRWGGAVTIEPWESISGNTEIVIDDEQLGWGAFNLEGAFGLSLDAETTAIHELGHALAYAVGKPDHFNVYSVEMENQLRSRRGGNRLRWAELPRDASKPGASLFVAPRPVKPVRPVAPTPEQIQEREKRRREELMRNIWKGLGRK
jgi:RHS repeat-associated protein